MSGKRTKGADVQCRNADSCPILAEKCVQDDEIGCYGVVVWNRPTSLACVRRAVGGSTMQWSIGRRRPPRAAWVSQCGQCGSAYIVAHGAKCRIEMPRYLPRVSGEYRAPAFPQDVGARQGALFERVAPDDPYTAWQTIDEAMAGAGLSGYDARESLIAQIRRWVNDGVAESRRRGGRAEYRWIRESG